jgi:type III secretion protein U
MAEKTEKATPKKLRDARKKGQVAKSKDFPAAFTFVVSIATIIFTSGYLFEQLASFMVDTFTMIGTESNLTRVAAGHIERAIEVIFQTSLPIMVLVSAVGVLIGFLTVGPLFSMEAMKPDIKRLNPVTNIKNMFKLKTFFELLKSVFKIAGALLLIWSVVWKSLPEIVACSALPLIGSAQVFTTFLIKVIIRVGIFFLAIAVFDLVFQRRQFAKEMKMEKFEVKQEMKDTEGNPEIKGQRRRTAQEIAYQDGPPATKRARAVITNPIHIAVALEYDAETHPAPKIATMGKGLTAEKIIDIAVEYNIPIMRNVPLAHLLYDTGQISQFVPEESYEAIAEVLKWVAQLEQREKVETELFT